MEPPSSRIYRYNYLLGVRPQIHHHSLMSKSPSFFQTALCALLVECKIRHLENSSGNILWGYQFDPTRRGNLRVAVVSASSNLQVLLSEGWLLLICFVWSLGVCVTSKAVEILDRITSHIVMSTTKPSVSPVSFRLASLAVARWLRTVCYMKRCMSIVITSVANLKYLNS